MTTNEIELLLCGGNYDILRIIFEYISEIDIIQCLGAIQKFFRCDYSKFISELKIKFDKCIEEKDLRILGLLTDINYLDVIYLDNSDALLLSRLINLKKLIIRYPCIDHYGFFCFPNMKNLKYLELNPCYNIQSEGFKQIGNLKSLETLILTGIRIDDFELFTNLYYLTHLKCTYCPILTKLVIPNNIFKSQFKYAIKQNKSHSSSNISKSE